MRYLFADRILQIDAHGAGTIATSKAFARTEEYLEGTFRAQGEVPASLILETMATAGSFLLTVKSCYRAHALLLKVKRAGFRRPVFAGESVLAHSQVVELQGDWSHPGMSAESLGLAEVAARCFVGGEPVADATLFFLGLPLARTLGPRHEELLKGILELLGYMDGRP
jgi:3-hydroxymyristoyl/3-hydroxydecanoyl-(acyl carrier protein) dehydratase